MGGRWCVVALLVVGLAASGVVEGGSAEEDFVERLPGQPAVPFKQYGGYVDVDLKHGRSIYYYFAEAYDKPEKRPLLLWLNGGPGCSSVGGGGFTELGPFYPTGDGRGLRLNEYSWNKEANLIFIDSPAGVAWSYSNTTSDYTTGDERTANDTRQFLLGFFDKFPQYKSHDLLLAGESYAGHYIPQLAVALLDYNEKSTGFKFNLKGVAIGNPFLSRDKGLYSVYEFWWMRGIFSDEGFENVKRNCNWGGWKSHNVSEACNAAIDTAMIALGGYLNGYHILLDTCNSMVVNEQLAQGKNVTQMNFGVDVCINEEREFYFNLPEVQAALHGNRSKDPRPWGVCLNSLNYTNTDGDVPMLPNIERIIKNDIPVMVYSGDQDGVVPFQGTRQEVMQIAKNLNFNITAPYRNWLHKNQTAGWAIEYGNMLTFATVRAASHMVPYSQPGRALTLFRAFVNKERLPFSLRDDEVKPATVD